MKSFLFTLFLSISLSFSYSQNPLKTSDSEDQTKWVDSVYQSLNINQKIGQLFTVWVATKEGKDKMNEIENIIKNNHLGGLIFSLGNVKDQANATNRFQSISKVPLLIGMDAEWGIGMRLSDAFSFPYNMTLGAVQDDNLIYKVGKRIGVHAKRLGVHINFAPVTDINTNPKNPIIGSRSFGEDKINVTKKSLAYLKGMQSEGIMGSAKHFPGHGDTSQDSHKTLPIINFSSKRINDIELHPYKELIKNNLSGVMVAHMEVPSLEKTSKLPSTLSKNIISKILKKRLKFKGLVITDAMDMKGVVDFNPKESADVAALLAGNDILLMPDDLDQSTIDIKKAINDGVISLKRLEYSVKKILMAKYKAGLNSIENIDLTNLEKDMNTDEDRALLDEVVSKSITLIKNDNDLIPIKDLTKKIAFLNLGDSNSDEFFKMLGHYTNIDKINLSSKLNQEEIIKMLDPYEVVVIGFHKSDKSPFESFNFSSKETALIEKISKNKDIILDVFAKPYALMDLNTKNIKSILVSYQNNDLAQNKSAQVIFGAIKPTGVLPVSIGEEFPLHSSISTKTLNRLSYSHPHRQGFDVNKLKKIDSIALYAIKNKMTPGAQILVSRNGDVIYNKTFGTKTYESKSMVFWDDVYDLASLTKILSTIPLMMSEFEKKSFDLDTNLSELLPNHKLGDKSDLTIKEMFSHHSGLYPWIPFYKKTLDSLDNKPSKKWYRSKKDDDFNIKVVENLFLKNLFLDSIQSNILYSQLSAKKEYVYSDLPYYFMKTYLEKKNNSNLDYQLKKKFLTTIGANNTSYNASSAFKKNRIVPSEIDNYFRHETLVGFVHDMGAAMQGGIGGHAGLFSNSNDVAKIMQMYLQRGLYGGLTYIDGITLDYFNTCYFCDQNNRRGIGFDKPQIDDSESTCGCVPNSSFGHSGFTGTYAWADPENHIVYVFLSNRTYPTMDNNLLSKNNVRTEIQKIIYESFN